MPYQSSSTGGAAVFMVTSDTRYLKFRKGIVSPRYAAMPTITRKVRRPATVNHLLKSPRRLRVVLGPEPSESESVDVSVSDENSLVGLPWTTRLCAGGQGRGPSSPPLLPCAPAPTCGKAWKVHAISTDSVEKARKNQKPTAKPASKRECPGPVWLMKPTISTKTMGPTNQPGAWSTMNACCRLCSSLAGTKDGRSITARKLPSCMGVLMTVLKITTMAEQGNRLS
mmetsp:Transcript_106843/g.279000  ORF Transcript_106843/g.279000 Transcript_106843/m.279000 type:complete len:226 (-) Transcript_106843:884-1561(-)